MARHNFPMQSSRQVYTSNVSTPINYSPSIDVKQSIKMPCNNASLLDNLQAATRENSFAHEKIGLPNFKQNGFAGEKSLLAKLFDKASCSSE
ncbi:hypothetical protein Ddc_14728 [Ditylenchus destructor]|nr:hypothetical protein Ddc_14728 [Ditylenchus destructor]